jgi:ABC-type multidrug transport system fused ATPase/permease subunit
MKTIFIDALDLLTSPQRVKGIKVFMLLVAASLLDLVSLAAFVPIIILLIDPNYSQNSFQIYIEPFTGSHSNGYFVIGFTVFATLIILLKTFITGRIVAVKAKFAYGVANDLAFQALTNYLNGPYEKYANADYTHEMNRISNLPLTFANNIIIPSGTIFSEALIASLMLVAAGLYDITALLVLFIITVPAIWFIHSQRKKLSVISSELKTKYPLALKHVLQTIEGFVEIKTHNRQSFFVNRFRQSHQALTKTLASEHGSTTIASRSTEALAAVCVSLLIGYAILSGMSFQSTLLLLSLYAGISFRIIPSINRILAATLQIRTNEYVVSELGRMTSSSSEIHNTAKPTFFNHTLELNNVDAGYKAGTAVIKNITLQIKKGEKIIVTGKSGAGKTTLMHLLLRFLKPQSGNMLLDGVLLSDHDESLRILIGYVPQNPYILDASIAENIAFGVNPEAIDYSKISTLLREMNLYEWTTELPDRFDTIIGERGVKISGGQRQRLAIARVLYREPEILLLDEITNQLDQHTEKEILHIIDKIASRKKTIIMISHRSQNVISFDSSYLMSEGQLEKFPQMAGVTTEQ